MSLRDLPVRPSVHGDDVITRVYREEVGLVVDEESLRKHVLRWKPLFELRKNITEEEKQLINGTYDAKQALSCLLKNTQLGGGCGHGTPSCWGMHLMLPVPLLLAIMHAQKYTVSPDIALIQANGGMGELE